MKRETRNLQHEKGGRIREVDYQPIQSDGRDGDARMFNEDLYIKTKGSWVKIMSGDKIINQELTRNINNIVSEGVLQHSSLTGVTANQHHQQGHAIDGGDHTGYLSVAKGGTGAETLTDGGILLGSGTGAITATAVLGDGEILIGDGTTDPVALDIGSSTAVTIVGTIGTGVWEGTAVASAYLDTDTAHLSGSQTFSGEKTFSANILMADDTSIGIADDAERIEFDGAGDISFLGCNVGIGVDDPDMDLEIKKTSANVTLKINAATAANDSQIQFCTGDSADWLIQVDGSAANDPLHFYDYESETSVMVLNNGKVGIGTASPNHMLTVDGDISVSNQINFSGQTNTDNLIGHINYNGYNNGTTRYRDLQISDGKTNNILYVDGSAGNVGIGTTSPAYPLTVSSNIADEGNIAAFFDPTMADTDFFNILIGKDASTHDCGVIRFNHTADGDATNFLSLGLFSTHNTLCVTSNARVGIGTTSPTEQLEIESATGGAMSLRRLDAGTISGDEVLGEILFKGRHSGTAGTGARIAAYGDSTWTTDTENNPTILAFYTQDDSDDDDIGSGAGTPRMVINNDGNVGIGVTDPDVTLEVLSGTTNQLKLSFDGTDNCTFGVDTDGYLTVTPSGSKILIADNDSIGSSSFASGFAGNGWIVDDGTAADATFDNLNIRGTLSVYELLIQQIRATNGNVLITSSAKVESVSGLATDDDAGTITFEPAIANTCPFVAGDIILSQQVNPGALVAVGAASSGVTGLIKKMVYRVASVSNNIATVTNISGGSETAFDNTAIPVAGDEFVRIGNYDDSSYASRQSVMYLTSDDTNAPFIDMKGDLNSYADWTNENSTKLRLGRLDGLTAGGTNEYGLWAGKSTTNYIKASNEGVFLRADADTYLSMDALGGPSNDTPALEFFDTNKKMEIYGGNIVMYADNGSTVMAQWANTTLTLGGATGATNDCVVMSAAGGVKIYDNSTDFVHISSTGMAVHAGSASLPVAQFGADTYIGLVASEHIKLTGSSMEMKDGSTVMMTLAAGSIGMSGVIEISSAGGTDNVCIGTWTEDAATHPDRAGTQKNVCIGVESGKMLDASGGTGQASYNQFIGWGAGYQCSSGASNVNIGNTSGAYNTTGDSNVAIGSGALFGDTVNNSSGDNNVCIGAAAGGAIEEDQGWGSAYENTVIGALAMPWCPSANNMIAIGHYSGGSIASKTIYTGSNCIFIGESARGDAAGIEQIAIGRNLACTANSTLRIGDSGANIFYDFSSSGGTISVTSDKRTKKNITDTDIGLDFINALKPIKFVGKNKHDYPDEFNVDKSVDRQPDPTRIQDGFIAQDVKETMDDLDVTFSGWKEDDDTRQMIGYDVFVVPLVKAVQELSAKVTALEAQIN